MARTIPGAPTPPQTPTTPKVPGVAPTTLWVATPHRTPPYVQLKTIMSLNNITWDQCVEKEELVGRIKQYRDHYRATNGL